jgi:chromosome segregation protein
MRLTRVEIHGFKSFADRTSLEFPAGLTAVVGPNGCGKSNVIDAIKWALGEQKASALRGDEMLDVIFKGNGARGARNFAEVSLVFDNASNVLPVEYSEVVVSRRLFRSGESEYLINRNSVRLKDVRNLFMDTGLGTGAYSIMEQGRIDAILSADPRDRRRIFEEAAGISRYRARRRESESKLERTEANLLRLGDVVEELEKQMRSLKQQAGRARSYIEARDRLRELKSRFYVHRWEELAEREIELAGEGKQLEAGEVEAREQLEARRNEVAALQEQLSNLRREVDSAADAFREVTSSLEALEGRRVSIRERQTEAESRRELLRNRVEGLSRALEARAAEQTELEQKLAALAADLETAEQAIAARERDEQAAGHALEAWRRAADERRRDALDRAGQLTEIRNRRAEAGSRHAACVASLDKIEQRLGVLRGEITEQETMQGELFAGSRDLDATLAVAHERLGSRQKERDEAAGQLSDVDAGLVAAREKLAATESRRDALAELIARREGVSPGAISVLESGLPGISGLVVDRLRSPRGLSEAVEAALGATAEAVLVDTRADALAALEHLAESGAGRVLLMPQDHLRPRAKAAPGERLLDHIEVLDHHEAIEALLGHVRLVADRTALQEAVLDGSTVWVTPDGELLDERGVLRGGRHGGEGGLVTRRAECDALADEQEALRARIGGSESSRVALEQQLAAFDAKIKDEESAARRLETERERAGERERQVGERRATLQRDLALTEKDRAAVAAELAVEAGERDAMTAREDELAASVTEDQDEETRAEAQRGTLEETLTERRRGAADARLALTALRERKESLGSELAHVARACEERVADRTAAEEELSGLAGSEQRLASELSEIEARERSLGELRDQGAGDLDRRRGLATEVGERLGAAQEDVAAREEALGGATEAVSAHRLKLQEIVIHRQTLRDKVLEELEVDLEQSRPETEAVDVDGPGQGAEQVEPDWVAIEAEIETLRDKMARAGNVNLAAVDELTEVEERHGFLTGQRDDLIAARTTLVDTISRVNKESRERFVTTFEEIQGHFRQIFRKLFSGGKADVFLAEGEDVLEAGIEIVAAPPGKDPRSISLLSGGERTLTAVGLLFALFRAKPSPVCMLDEVDAALDETNIDRFCNVLEDFLAGSQFIVVTHARRTMSYADTLYGITMQEHGVSRALSLTMAEYDHEQHHGKSPAEEPTADEPAPTVAEERAALSAEATSPTSTGNGHPPVPGRSSVTEAAAEAERELGQSG